MYIFEHFLFINRTKEERRMMKIACELKLCIFLHAGWENKGERRKGWENKGEGKRAGK